MERVLVCGDRNFTDGRTILEELRRIQAIYGIAVVIEGEAKGADTLGRLAAVSLGIRVERYPAEWEKYGKAAGPIRNQQMLTKGNPTMVLAFHNDIDHSKGTKDMVMRSIKAGIPTKVIKGKDATRI